MNCKLCRDATKLVEAHIIPESFYRSIKISDKPLRIFSGEKGVYPKKSWKGLYDPNILCAKCEKLFDLYDDYGAKILLELRLEKEDVKDENNQELIGYLVHGIDYPKFKLFFMSILWRAAVSSNDAFKKVELGPHLAKLEEHIKEKNPGTYDDFSVILCEQIFPNDRAMMIIPFPRKLMGGINFYEISIGRYLAFLKVDKRKTPDDSMVLKPKEAVPVVYLNFKGSSSEKIAQRIIKANKQLGKK